MNGKHLLWAGLLVLAACGLTWGQAPQPAPTEAEVLSPEQLQKFFEQARVRRLSMERAQVTAEIEGGQLMVLDEDRIKEAVKHLSTGAKNTWEDNAERTCRAFGMVHPRFGRALEKFRKGDCERAAQDFKAIISTSERDTSYFAAAKRFCYAEALAWTGMKTRWRPISTWSRPCPIGSASPPCLCWRPGGCMRRCTGD